MFELEQRQWKILFHLLTTFLLRRQCFFRQSFLLSSDCWVAEFPTLHSPRETSLPIYESTDFCNHRVQQRSWKKRLQFVRKLFPCLLRSNLFAVQTMRSLLPFAQFVLLVLTVSATSTLITILIPVLLHHRHHRH